MTLPVSGDSAYFLDLYSRYRRDAASVPADWRFHFETLDAGEPRNVDHPALLAEQLLDAYRRFGHQEATLDPLSLASGANSPEIDAFRRRPDGQIRLALAGEDYTLDHDAAHKKLAGIYCGNAAIEAGHVSDAESRDWLFRRFESEMVLAPDEATYGRTLEAVLLADEFEKFIKTKWPTKKRFGIEGAEAAAVILKEAFRKAAENGAKEVVIGGMHRGRLATLATVLGKSLPVLIAEIKGRDITEGDASFTGDVPYHNGLSTTIDTGMGPLDVRLLPHPSHLIVVAPVAAGAARARQESRRGDDGNRIDTEAGREAVLPLLMHTDAAFAGQGLVSELLQLGGLEGYRSGGTIHLVVNNQIGFTTTPQEGRSSPHPTDIGKAYGIPVLHVNGDDPIAAAAVARVAVNWRNATGRDAIIDLVCYRRNGHNELDEPRFTQPRIWAAIDSRPALRVAYAEAVKAKFPQAHEKAESTRAKFQEALKRAYATYDTVKPNEVSNETEIFAASQASRNAGRSLAVETGIDAETILSLARIITAIPDGIDPDPKVRNFARARLESVEKNTGFNMATGEALAFASLLAEGTSVRLSGQDSVRGTFTQRHLTVHDRLTGQTAMPIANAARGQARFDAINSPLIEYAVLGFEYGMSLADPDRLFVWEAQFGDFLNGAQVAVDQFIVTAEAKWRMASSLVIALPHGSEGQGPDHSSARIERILQSCASDNIIVANPSTPANLFHLYRRQQRAADRKPLFLIAPKSLLRQRDCVSNLADIGPGTSFLPIIVDKPATRCRQVVLCSGKIYYGLRNALNENRLDDVALVRIEQIYPFPAEGLRKVLDANPGASITWCQEEPRNQGAWSFVHETLLESMPEIRLSYSGRSRMAAAAGGSIDRHEIEQSEIIADTLGLNDLRSAAAAE